MALDDPRGLTQKAEDPASDFVPERPRLLRLAYRMLGSLAEAEDIVQEAYLRWHAADRTSVRVPAAFLARTVTRLAIDALRRARTRREAYPGPWLPEPWIEPTDGADPITLPLMLVLERLSPLERAAFLLHDVFELDFAAIGAMLERAPDSCRQLASRARRHLALARPRFSASPDEGERLARAFLQASRSGDLEALRDLLAADAVATTDGGGKVMAALNPIHGGDRVARFFAGIARKRPDHPSLPPRWLRIDGLPGYVTLEPGQILQTTALGIENGRVAQLFITRNPEKLRHLEALAAETRMPGIAHPSLSP